MMSIKKLEQMLEGNVKLHHELLLTQRIMPVSVACAELVEFVLNTEDPWISPEFNSEKIAQKYLKEKEKRRSKGLARWLSWFPRSNVEETSDIHSLSSPSLLYSSPPPSPPSPSPLSFSSPPSITNSCPLPATSSVRTPLRWQLSSLASGSSSFPSLPIPSSSPSRPHSLILVKSSSNTFSLPTPTPPPSPPPSIPQPQFISLPPEVMQYVMKFLDALSIVSVARVCSIAHVNAVAYVATSLEQFQKDRFIQRTSIRFDIPYGCNPWKRDRLSREKDRTARLYRETISRSIGLALNQEKRNQEKQVLMPIIAGYRCEQLHTVVQNLYAYAKQQSNTPAPPPPPNSITQQLFPMLNWSFVKQPAPGNPTEQCGVPSQSALSLLSPQDTPVLIPTDFSFKVDAMQFRVTDASASIHLFPKTIGHYQYCTGVVFCASLNYTRPVDDPSTITDMPLVMGPDNRRRNVSVRLPAGCTRPRRLRPGESPLEQSLRIFLHLCSTRWFEDVPIILLFTASDVFMQDLQLHELRNVFPTYQGGNDYGRATQFLTHLFHAQNSSPYRKIYTYFIPQDASAEDTVVPILFNCVKNIVLERGLRYASIIL